MKASIHSGNLVRGLHPRGPQEIFKAPNPRHLDADGLERSTIKRAIDHVVTQPGTGQRLPGNIDMTLIAGCSHLLHRRQRRADIEPAAVLNRDIVDEQRVVQAIRFALRKNHGNHPLRIEHADRRRVKCSHRNRNSRPPSRMEIRKVRCQVQWLGEVTILVTQGEVGRQNNRIARTPARVSQHDLRQVRRCEWFGLVAPEGQRIAGEMEDTVAPHVHTNVRLPPTTVLRYPMKPERIRRCVEMLMVDGKPVPRRLHRTGSLHLGLRIEVAVGSQAIVEQNTVIVRRLRPRPRTAQPQRQHIPKQPPIGATGDVTLEEAECSRLALARFRFCLWLLCLRGLCLNGSRSRSVLRAGRLCLRLA